jgi:hypothetical protein
MGYQLWIQMLAGIMVTRVMVQVMLMTLRQDLELLMGINEKRK